MTGLICGVDEAGRGPLAGAVFAAAVILNVDRPIDGLADSKALSATKREILSENIKQSSLAWSIAFASAAEIDELNILQATMLAMKRAVAQLKIAPSEVLIDGNRVPIGLPCAARAIVRGDATEPAISAASILAKVARDAEMRALAETYPAYGFAEHKGYPTAAHLAALQRFGPCDVHRVSFAPVKRALLAHRD